MSMEIRQIDSNTWALFADDSDVGTLVEAQFNQQQLGGYCVAYRFVMGQPFRDKIKEIGDVAIPIGGTMVVYSSNAPQNIANYGFQFVASGWDRNDNWTQNATIIVNKHDSGIYTSSGVGRKFIFLFKRIQWDFRNIPFSPTNG